MSDEPVSFQLVSFVYINSLNTCVSKFTKKIRYCEDSSSKNHFYFVTITPKPK